MTLASLSITVAQGPVEFTTRIALTRNRRAKRHAISNFAIAAREAQRLSNELLVSHAVLQAANGAYEVVRLVQPHSPSTVLVDEVGTDDAIRSVRLLKSSRTLAGIAGSSGFWDLRDRMSVDIPQVGPVA